MRSSTSEEESEASLNTQDAKCILAQKSILKRLGPTILFKWEREDEIKTFFAILDEHSRMLDGSDCENHLKHMKAFINTRRSKTRVIGDTVLTAKHKFMKNLKKSLGSKSK